MSLDGSIDTFYQRKDSLVERTIHTSMIILLLAHGTFLVINDNFNVNIFLILFIWFTAFLVIKATDKLQDFARSFLAAIPDQATKGQFEKDYEIQFRQRINFVRAGVISTAITSLLVLVVLEPVTKGPTLYFEIAECAIIGFLFGMAWWGVIWIILTIRKYINHIELDHLNSDNCGGTEFIGQNLTFTSTALLVTGLLIFLYLLFQDWFNVDFVSEYGSFQAGPATIIPIVALSLPLVVFGYCIYLVRQRLIEFRNERARLLREELTPVYLMNVKKLRSLEEVTFAREKLAHAINKEKMLNEMNIFPFRSRSSFTTRMAVFAGTTIINLLLKLITNLSKTSTPTFN